MGPLILKKITKILDSLNISDVDILGGDPTVFSVVKHFTPEISNVNQYEKTVLKVSFPKLAVFKGTGAKTYQVNRSWPIKRFLQRILSAFNLTKVDRYYLETNKGFKFENSETFSNYGFGSVFPGLQVALKRIPLKKKTKPESASASSSAKSAGSKRPESSSAASAPKLSLRPSATTSSSHSASTASSTDSVSTSRSTSRRSNASESKRPPESPSSKSSSSHSSSTARRKSEKRPETKSSDKKEEKSTHRDRSKRASMIVTSALAAEALSAENDKNVKERSSKSSLSGAPADTVSGSPSKISSSSSKRLKDQRDEKKSDDSAARKVERARSRTVGSAAEDPAAAAPQTKGETSTATTSAFEKKTSHVGKTADSKSPTKRGAAPSSSREKPPVAASSASKKAKRAPKKPTSKLPVLLVLPQPFKKRLQRVMLATTTTASTIAKIVCEKLVPKDAGVSASSILMRPLLLDEPLHPDAAISCYGFGTKFQKWELSFTVAKEEEVSSKKKELYSSHFAWINVPEATPALTLDEAKRSLIKLDRYLMSRKDSVASNRLKISEKELSSAKRELESLKRHLSDAKKDRDRYRKERDEAKSSLKQIVDSSKDTEKIAMIQLQQENKRLNEVIAEMTNDSFQLTMTMHELRELVEKAEVSHNAALSKMRADYGEVVEQLEQQIEYLLGRNEWIAQAYQELRAEADELQTKLDSTEEQRDILAEELERMKSLPISSNSVQDSAPVPPESDAGEVPAAPPPPPPPLPSETPKAPPPPPLPSSSSNGNVSQNRGGGFALPAPGEFPKLRSVTADDKPRPAPSATSADAIISELKNFKFTSLKTTDETHVAQKLERKQSFRSALASEISNFSKNNLRKAAVENASRKRHVAESEFASALKKRFATILAEDDAVEDLDEDDDWDDSDTAASKPSSPEDAEDDIDDEEDNEDGSSAAGDVSTTTTEMDDDEIEEDFDLADGDAADEVDEDDDGEDDDDYSDEDDYYYDDFHL